MAALPKPTKPIAGELVTSTPPSLSFRGADVGDLSLLATWLHNILGSIYPEKTVGEYETILAKRVGQFTVVNYASTPVGMFALRAFGNDSKNIWAYALYLKEDFRGLRATPQIGAELRRQALEAGASHIIFDTIYGRKDAMYRRYGAQPFASSGEKTYFVADIAPPGK